LQGTYSTSLKKGRQKQTRANFSKKEKKHQQKQQQQQQRSQARIDTSRLESKRTYKQVTGSCRYVAMGTSAQLKIGSVSQAYVRGHVILESISGADFQRRVALAVSGYSDVRLVLERFNKSRSRIPSRAKTLATDMSLVYVQARSGGATVGTSTGSGDLARAFAERP
jgi:hypothetical protein